MSRIEHRPSTEPRAIEDRAIGALLGLAVGDAIGTTLGFRARDTYEVLTDMVGGGPFNLKVGEWTDDTAMALALSDNLEAREDFDEQDLLGRFINCWQAGRRELRTTTACGGTTSVRCGRRHGFSRCIVMEAAAS